MPLSVWLDSNQRPLASEASSLKPSELHTVIIGVVGFEPTTFRIQTEHADQTALHSVKVTTWTTGGKCARSVSDLAVLVGIEPTVGCINSAVRLPIPPQDNILAVHVGFEPTTL